MFEKLFVKTSDLVFPHDRAGGRLVNTRATTGLLLAENHLTRRLFGAMLQRIWALPAPTG